MTKLQNQPNKSLKNSLLVSGTLALSLTLATAVQAGYNPPPKPSRPSVPTGSTGTRGGCEGGSATALTILAPLSHAGQTVSQRPTFVWFVPDAKSYPIEFSLFELNEKGKGKQLETVKLQSSQGVMQLVLPKTKSTLAVGSQYIWQVAILCDPNHPSSDLVAEAVIEVVGMPPQLKSALSQTKDPLARAQLYAEAGFWYDALGETLSAHSGTKAFMLSLLEDLVQLEAKQNSQIASKQSQQIEEIVTIERQAN
jgi:hypothetical protein